MQVLCCKRCGGFLEKQGDVYICSFCGAPHKEEEVRRYTEELSRILDEQKQEALANLRKQLWLEFNEEFYDRAEINRLAKEIKKYLPDDFFANFCDLASSGNARKLNKFLFSTDVVEQSECIIWDMIGFLLRPLREETLLAVNDLLGRARNAGLDMEQFRHYNGLLTEKAKELNDGVYDVTLPRDVFVAYSSADMEKMGELVEALERQNIRCFVAARNLQHGAIQNYEEKLYEAMDHCKTVVFVSSENSRNRMCDALTVELPYIREKDVEAAPAEFRNYYEKIPSEYKKPRVEYIVSEHTNTAADKVVEEFFAGFEYCYDPKEVANRILEYLSVKSTATVKYCIACGAGNGKRAKFCSACGGREFVPTREEWDEIQRAQAEQTGRAAGVVRNLEEDRRRAEEEKKKAEADAASLRAELERLKTETAKPVAKPAASPAKDFKIRGGKLIKYKGKGGDVVIPQGVKIIDDGAFSCCSGLTSITIPNSVTSIGEWAFSGCSGLTSITIPNSVTSIGNEAFSSCSGLKSITIPNSVTSIGGYAFCKCRGVTSITIPNSVTSIGDAAFGGCSGLKSITIPNSVTSIGKKAFNYCDGLTSITIPNSVTSIGEWAFSGCSGLTSITIPNSVTSIGNEAFSSCSGLKSITIPNSVKSIGKKAFSFCSGLESITVEEGNPVYHSEGNCLIETQSKKLIVGCKNSIIPADGSVTSIWGYAFYYCDGLTSITIPNSVTSIGEWAFSGCSRLTSITIPNSVKSIGKKAFEGCSGLTEITIPDSVTSIGEGTFRYCRGLKSITIPNSITSIGNEAFSSCSGLKSITIPNSVTNIGNEAFSSCSGLKSITIPNSVTSIGFGAFGSCSSLESITIPNSVTSIGEWVFTGFYAKIYCHRKKPLFWPKGWDERLKGKIIWISDAV